MTIKELIAEVESIFPQYAEAGLIDRIAITNRVLKALKKFGNNIMIKNETFIDVKGGKAEIPKDYWNLLIAIKCEPHSYKITKGTRDTLLDSYFFRERTEHNSIWNAAYEEYVPEETTTISEKFVFRKAEADFNYKPVAPLKLVKAFKRNTCANNSPYKSTDFARNSPYEINIYNRHLQTNFTNGTIYMQYLGLPTDDDGEVIIPETQHSELEEYLLYLGQEEVLYRVMMSNDDPNVSNKYLLVKQLAKDAQQLAYTETKMSTLRNWKEKFNERKKRQTLAYERLLPNI